MINIMADALAIAAMAPDAFEYPDMKKSLDNFKKILYNLFVNLFYKLQRFS